MSTAAVLNASPSGMLLWTTALAVPDNHLDDLEEDGHQVDLTTTTTTACRCLFGPVDHDQVRRDLKAALLKAQTADQERWNFDFKSCVPVSGPGRYEWSRVDENATDSVPVAYARAGTPRRRPLADRSVNGVVKVSTDDGDCWKPRSNILEVDEVRSGLTTTPCNERLAAPSTDVAVRQEHSTWAKRVSSEVSLQIHESPSPRGRRRSVRKTVVPPSPGVYMTSEDSQSCLQKRKSKTILDYFTVNKKPCQNQHSNSIAKRRL